MTSDEARDRFGDALDGTLSAADKAAFDAAIAADAELAEELALYRKIATGAAGLGERSSQPPGELAPGAAGLGDAIPPPDFLPRVQARIRKSTRGRYFRDRNAESAGPSTATTMALIVLTILVLVAAAIYVHQRFIDVEVPAPTTTTSPPLPS